MQSLECESSNGVACHDIRGLPAPRASAGLTARSRASQADCRGESQEIEDGNARYNGRLGDESKHHNQPVRMELRSVVTQRSTVCECEGSDVLSAASSSSNVTTTNSRCHSASCTAIDSCCPRQSDPNTTIHPIDKEISNGSSSSEFGCRVRLQAGERHRTSIVGSQRIAARTAEMCRPHKTRSSAVCSSFGIEQFEKHLAATIARWFKDDRLTAATSRYRRRESARRRRCQEQMMMMTTTTTAIATTTTTTAATAEATTTTTTRPEAVATTTTTTTTRPEAVATATTTTTTGAAAATITPTAATRTTTKATSWTCCYCNFSTASRRERRFHFRVHKRSGDSSCVDCGAHFSGLRSLREHRAFVNLQAKHEQVGGGPRCSRRVGATHRIAPRGAAAGMDTTTTTTTGTTATTTGTTATTIITAAPVSAPALLQQPHHQHGVCHNGQRRRSFHVWRGR